MTHREKRFLKEMTPLIERLHDLWFPSDKLSPEGYNYECSFCDHHCGNHHLGHDEDCISDRAKRVILAFEELEKRESLKVDHRGNPRDPESLQSLIDSFKVDAILDILFKDVKKFVSFDYQDPENEGVVCPCFLFLTDNPRQHAPDCIHQSLSKALGKLIKP